MRDGKIRRDRLTSCYLLIYISMPCDKLKEELIWLWPLCVLLGHAGMMLLKGINKILR